jgi:transcription initiation factor IIE alpha subunit
MQFVVAIVWEDGEKIPDNSKYCMHCGVKIESANSNQEIQSKEKNVESLKKQFREDMFKIYRDASTIGY